MDHNARPPGVKKLFRFLSRAKDDIVSDVNDEFAFHLDMRTADLVREGLTEAEARRQALREFGNRPAGVKACADAGVTIERQRTIGRLAAELRQDLRFGLRLLVRSPGFAVVAILTLAVAIGANTAIFSLVNALALKPLPAAAAHELVRIHTGTSHTSWLNYEDIRERSQVFADVAAHARTALSMTDGNSSTKVGVDTVTSNYLAMLGVPAMRGRIFDATDTRTDVVVLAERTWRTQFASDPSVIGRMISLNRRRYEVVGVMPAGFRGIGPPGLVTELWMPIDRSQSAALLRDREKTAFEIVGRLKPGVAVERAQAETRGLTMLIRAEHPALPARFASNTEVFRVDGFGGYRGMAGTLAPVFLFVGLMTIVAGFVLLVGCANISGLLLGRAAARRREIGLRLALGAGRGRLIRQLLTESLILATIGSVAGVLLAVWLGTLMKSAVSGLPIPFELDLGLDRRVLLYTLALAVLTTVLCGLAPARQATRIDLLPALKEGDLERHRQRMRYVLIVGQVAISCLLLLWSGLFLRSLANVHRVDPGFNPSGVLVAIIGFDRDIEPPGGFASFVSELQARASELPGVRSAGISTILPLAFRGREEFRARVETDGPDARGRWILANRVTPGWFETVQIPLVAGRDFASGDRPGSPRVVIVNETAARQFWNGQALGKRVHDAEVVGIVRDSKYWTLGEIIEPTLYLPLAQEHLREIHLHVRTENAAAGPAGIRRLLQELVPDLHAEIQPMTDAVSAALVPARIGAMATGGFGTLGALLTMIGIYGLVAFTVAQRRREIGIRKAIGAREIDIISLVVRGSLVPVGIGLAAGLTFGVLGALALSGFIFGVSATDPLTIAGTAAVVLSTALLASAFPALKATRVDALVTLKAE